jgi:hypothetical protein
VTHEAVRPPAPATAPHRFVRSGAAAGVASALAFAAIHHAIISDIWYSAPAMTIAGAACGLSVAWSFTLIDRPSTIEWLRYNVLLVTMLILLGVVSVLVFEPVTTVAAVVEANEPPGALIRQALPMTAGFTLGSATILTLVYARTLRFFAAALVTSTALVLVLGLNVSVIGLVEVPRGSAYLIAELIALIVAIGAIYVATFVALERTRLRGAAVVSPER